MRVNRDFKKDKALLKEKFTLFCETETMCVKTIVISVKTRGGY
jgi:hypothetical protein